MVPPWKAWWIVDLFIFGFHLAEFYLRDGVAIVGSMLEQRLAKNYQQPVERSGSSTAMSWSSESNHKSSQIPDWIEGTPYRNLILDMNAIVSRQFHQFLMNQSIDISPRRWYCHRPNISRGWSRKRLQCWGAGGKLGSNFPPNMFQNVKNTFPLIFHDFDGCNHHISRGFSQPPAKRASICRDYPTILGVTLLVLVQLGTSPYPRTKSQIHFRHAQLVIKFEGSWDPKWSKARL